MTLSPTQKKILMIGVPIVAALGLYSYLKSRSSTSSAGSSTTTSGTTSTADNAVGLDQLATFENTYNSQIGSLGQAVTALQTQVNGLTATPPPATTTPSPPAAPAPAAPGFGASTFGGQQYVNLGEVGSPYNGKVNGSIYQVQGGAPVGFVYPGSTTVQYGVNAEQHAPIGTELVTPYEYGPQVSKAPAST